MLPCPRCQRANPDAAAYCHFDGVRLGRTGNTRFAVAAPAAPAGPARLPLDFVFPSGRRCETFDDLLRGCQEEWTTAGELLRKGAFRQFFTGAGRLDLAKQADDAQQNADDDLALHAFLGKLPVTTPPKPRLDLQPRRILLGVLRRGEVRQITLGVVNVGSGLLQGTIAVTDGDGWLTIAGANNVGVRTLQVVREFAVRLQVDTRQLVAPRKYAGRLTLITDGGIVEVPVRLEVAAQPFPRPPFAGAGSPRDLAVRMRAQPKAAGPALESGDVARWFTANGWAYPVVGPPAPGTAAVQQFFECMGLARAPRVRLAESEAVFHCRPGQKALGRASITTSDRKWVYAHADADVPWLRVTTPVVGGPQAADIDFEADSSGLQTGTTHEGAVRLTTNGDQVLTLRVRLSVARPPEPAAARWVGPILAGALAGLLLRLVLAVPTDLFGGTVGGPGAVRDAAFMRAFVQGNWWPGAVVGVWLMVRRGRWADLPAGLLAGAAGGLAAAGTLACLLPLFDALPLFLWGRSRPGLPSGILTPAWVALTAGCWALFGAAAGLAFSCSGSRLPQSFGRPLAAILRGVGLRRLAAIVALP